jgi:hypothetical protein
MRYVSAPSFDLITSYPLNSICFMLLMNDAAVYVPFLYLNCFSQEPVNSADFTVLIVYQPIE